MDDCDVCCAEDVPVTAFEDDEGGTWLACRRCEPTNDLTEIKIDA